MYMAALWYHYFLPLLVNCAVLDAHFFYSNAVFGWDYNYQMVLVVANRDAMTQIVNWSFMN